MTCEWVREQLGELLDGVQLRDQAPLQAHLAECQACRAWYEQQQRAIAALEQLDAVPVPLDFRARVLDRLPEAALPARLPRVAQAREPEKPRSFWADLARPTARRRLMPALALAASLLLVAGLLYVFQVGEPATTPGAATGSAAWVALGGLGVAVVLLVVAFLFWRRKR